jgi:60 kDa SS-A/Ro ribonucleoprotein
VVELLTNRSEATQTIVQRLQDENYIRKSRLHPITILTALKQYSLGRGMRGSLTWTAIPKIVDALDSAFYLAFANAKPVGGAGVCLALDVSGSMSGARGENVLSPREITAAMALVTANVEPNHEIMAFSRGFVPLSISPNMRLDQVLKTIEGLPFDGTDCAQPMLWAMNKKEQFDLFVIYTDNETWCGNIHPSQALQQYRQKFNQKARLVVCATDATKFSIADPKDPGMLDIAGFSSDVPEVISSFGRGEI